MSDYLIYLPFVLIAAGTLLQVYLHLSARRMRGKELHGEVGFDELDHLLPDWRERTPLLLYFSSAYCAPCKAMAPSIDALAAQTGAVLKLDAIAHGELATRLGARGAPAFVLLEQGRVARVHLGSLSPGALRKMLDVLEQG
ncbi:MAG: thioredoxin family protein [Thiohalomonadaceae bacterium]